jgi:hypothetical protein
MGKPLAFELVEVHVNCVERSARTFRGDKVIHEKIGLTLVLAITVTVHSINLRDGVDAVLFRRLSALSPSHHSADFSDSWKGNSVPEIEISPPS